jgi:hypothetical protein
MRRTLLGLAGLALVAHLALTGWMVMKLEDIDSDLFTVQSSAFSNVRWQTCALLAEAHRPRPSYCAGVVAFD